MIACHLLVVGPATNLTAFLAREDWPPEFSGIEPLELSPRRRLWQFESRSVPIGYSGAVSLRHPRLAFVVDFDDGRTKGIVVAINGKVRRRQLRYRP